MAQRGSDHERGRLPGAAPPLSPWLPPLFWLAGAIVLAAVVLAVVPRPGLLDDPHPAYQRPGFLSSPDSSRTIRDLSLPGAPIGRRPVLLVFDRRLPDRTRFARLQRRLPRRISLVLVVASPVPERAHFPTAVVSDPGGRVARALAMRRPKDGGPPVGYALIDREARVRYATLDPGYLEHGDEAATMAAALP